MSATAGAYREQMPWLRTGQTSHDAAATTLAETTDFYRPVPESDLPKELVFDFFSSAAARDYISAMVDVPAREHETTIYDRIALHVYPEQLAGGRFTNVYDLSFDPRTVSPAIRVDRQPKSVAHFLAESPDAIAAASGAFLYLVDASSGTPRQPALNLALKSAGVVSSPPVVDRETLIANADGLSAKVVRALGELTIDGRTLTWSGSRTDHEADARIFGNGNVVVEHQDNHERGARKERIRVLNEASRYTPAIEADACLVDAGLVACEDGRFRVMDVSHHGAMDLFRYDAVLRCRRGDLWRGTDSLVQLRTIDTLALDTDIRGAISVGPLLSDEHFEAHAINADPSLGSDPPFIDVPMVRLALYGTAKGRLHFRLFDGRPESISFKGVTPREAVTNIRRDDDIEWGCFLDPGRTAKLVTRTADKLMSYGNAHYLQWPSKPGGHYTWVPAAGRPVPSAITLA